MRYSIALCTDGFIKSDVKYLIKRMNKLGLSCKIRLHSNLPRIVIPSSGTKTFFEYIGLSSPVKCYKYKFPEINKLEDNGNG